MRSQRPMTLGGRRRRLTVCGLAALAVTATACPIDPPAPTLSVTTSGLPVVTLGEAYSSQLAASGATGTVHWTLDTGELPVGIALTDGGLLQGTSTAMGRGGFIRVRATDDSATATRLLPVATVSNDDGATVSTGAPLPDGDELTIGVAAPQGCGTPPCPVWLGRYRSDGSLDPLDSLSVGEFLAPGSNVVSPDATLALAVQYDGHGVVVADAATGATLHVLVDSPSFVSTALGFSPDGHHVAVSGDDEVKVFETTTWSLVRTFPTAAAVAWSPDSTELVLGSYVVADEITVYSTSNPAADRAIPAPFPGTMCATSAWAPTGRVAVYCPSNHAVVTASALDGTDVRVIRPVDPPCCADLPVQVPTFSPSGSHLTFGVVTFEQSFPPAMTDAHVVVAPDVDGATATPLTTSTTDNHITIVAGWG